MKGAYFAILTQALAVAFATLLIATIKQTGGFNGLNTFTTFFGHNLYDPTVKKNLYLIAAGAADRVPGDRLAALPQPLRRAARRHPRRRGAHPLPRLRPGQHQAGRVRGRRDHGEHRRRACSCRSPASSRRPTSTPPASIMLIAGVALGGRASLLGPALGAIAVGYGQSTLSEKFPTQWTYFLGALFIVVMLFLPGGVASLWPKLKALVPRRSERAAPTRDRRPRRAGGGGVTALVPRRGLPGDPRPDRRLRRLQGDRRRRPHPPAGAAALPHRPERRRQDHPGRRPHRAGARHRRRPSSATSDLLDDEVAQDRAPRDRPDVPDRDRVRAAQRAAEPRHRRRRAPQARWPLLLARAQGARARRAGAGDDRPDRAGAPTGRDPRPRAEAVARDRHAAGAGRAR